jgi:monovalent cation:H+ antiporter, CPA1 family
MLAGPGVLFSALITAAFFKYALQYTYFTFVQALLFGALISATDPVAVVALLKVSIQY